MAGPTHTEIVSPDTGNTWACPTKALGAFLAKGWVMADAEAAGPYEALTVPAIRDEIAMRNEGRDDATRIPVSGNKPELIAALVADDTKEK